VATVAFSAVVEASDGVSWQMAVSGVTGELED
jgi:hypothetical protein